MTDKEKKKEYRKRRYEDYKLAYAALMLCYPFGLEDLDGEEWRDIKGFEGHYQISNYGRVKSFRNGKVKILKPTLHTAGYLIVALGRRRKFKIHRLVAMAFIPNPENKPQLDHIDNCKMNNFVENLRRATASENNKYAYDTSAKQSKFNAEQVRWIRQNYKPFDKKFGQKALAKKFGVSQTAIRAILNHKIHKNVE